MRACLTDLVVYSGIEEIVGCQGDELQLNFAVGLAYILLSVSIKPLQLRRRLLLLLFGGGCHRIDLPGHDNIVAETRYSCQGISSVGDTTPCLVLHPADPIPQLSSPRGVAPNCRAQSVISGGPAQGSPRR